MGRKGRAATTHSQIERIRTLEGSIDAMVAESAMVEMVRYGSSVNLDESLECPHTHWYDACT